MTSYKKKHCSLQYHYQFLPSFILLSVRSLKRHAIDIAYDKTLTENYIFLLKETQVSQTDNLISAMQNILDILALPFLTKASFLSVIRKMMRFDFSSFLSKNILEKLLVWY